MLKEILEQGQRSIDATLEKLLPAATVRPESIHQAMRHSVFAGGKRLRPILCMEAARMIAGRLPEGVEELMHRQCLKRKLMPDEIAKFTVFLASDEASACTSQHYVVDGGCV